MCRLLLIVSASFLLTTSCTKDQFCSFILPSGLSAVRVNGGVVLDFQSNVVYDFIGRVETCEADEIEIYSSDDGEDYSFLQTVGSSTKILSLSGLLMDRPYYFRTVAKKGGEEVARSEPIMIVPKDWDSLQFTNQDFNHEIEQFEYSDDEQFILFSDFRDRWFYIDVAEPRRKQSFADGVGRAKWVLGGKAIVYSTVSVDRSTSVDFTYNSGINYFDIEKDTIITLLSFEPGTFNVFDLVVSSDGESVFYGSNEGSNNGIYDYWSLSIASGERSKLTNFAVDGFRLNGFARRARMSDKIYFAGAFADDSSDGSSIFCLDISSGELQPIVKSQFYDENLFPSDDGLKIAFYSRRTGRTELWVFDIMEDTFYQITDRNRYIVYGGKTNVDWSSDSEITMLIREDLDLKFALFRLGR